MKDLNIVKLSSFVCQIMVQMKKYKAKLFIYHPITALSLGEKKDIKDTIQLRKNYCTLYCSFRFNFVIPWPGADLHNFRQREIRLYTWFYVYNAFNRHICSVLYSWNDHPGENGKNKRLVNKKQFTVYGLVSE